LLVAAFVTQKSVALALEARTRRVAAQSDAIEGIQLA
jgi:hypothetical protein